MPTNRRTTVTEEQWLEAVEAYELGTKHGVQIAAKIGVSASTISREFKRRGCVKGCRAWETVIELEAAVDAKARRETRRRAAEEAAAWERSAALDKLIGDMVRSLVAAERAGNMSSVAPVIERVGKAIGVKPLR